MDKDGVATLVGYTESSNFPTASPYDNSLGGTRDGFVSRFNGSGTALAYSTFLGGSSDDEVRGLALDRDNYALLAGTTASTNFPTVSPIQGAR